MLVLVPHLYEKVKFNNVWIRRFSQSIVFVYFLSGKFSAGEEGAST